MRIKLGKICFNPGNGKVVDKCKIWLHSKMFKGFKC